MNRNVEAHFAELPRADIRRSMFDLSRDHKMSFNVGELVPFYCNTDILPGDTFDLTTSIVARLQTLQTPIMSDIYMDTYWFFIPWRLVYDHFPEFMGENTQSAWIPQTEYTLPILKYPDGGFAVGTIADHLGIPVNVKPDDERLCAHVGGVRAYALVCDTWFRDQNLTDPLNIPTGDADQQGSNGSNYINDVANGGKPFLAAKYHDPYTSMLPSPQKSAPINIFGEKITDTPASTPGTFHQIPVYSGEYPSALALNAGYPAKYNTVKKDGTIGTGSDWYNFRTTSSANVQGKGLNDVAATDLMFYPTNLYADASYLDLSINQLRLAFQLQKYYERAARSGSRYREYILGAFSVHSPDARMMIPEYLGGHRFPLSIHQIANQSAGENDFLGDLGAMSNTMDIHSDFIKSFTEHGILLGVACCRYQHSYPGIEKQWLRRDKLDFYDPIFANIGEVGVPRACVFMDNDSNRDDIMGYQEAWFEYRMSPDFVSGELRPGIDNSLANWHLGDYYTEAPHLSDSWIREDKTNVDRVLQVTSSVSNQIFCDFYCKINATRPLPVYSVPGLIDHH